MFFFSMAGLATCFRVAACPSTSRQVTTLEGISAKRWARFLQGHLRRAQLGIIINDDYGFLRIIGH